MDLESGAVICGYFMLCRNLLYLVLVPFVIDTKNQDMAITITIFCLMVTLISAYIYGSILLTRSSQTVNHFILIAKILINFYFSATPHICCFT